MSDQKKWFKVWGSILVDPSLSGLPLADMGRWVRLGAWMTTCGERGKLVITHPCPMFLVAMEVESFADAVMALKRLPNVSLQEWNRDNGSFIVTMRNWHKYQIDSTSGERVKRIRHKRRGEEKLTSKSTSTPSATLPRAAGRAPTTLKNGNGKYTAEPAKTTPPTPPLETRCPDCGYLTWKCACLFPEPEQMTADEMQAIRMKNMGSPNEDR